MRKKIILGLLPLLAILMVVGAYAVTLFAQLGGAVDVILRENYISIIASENMKESAERMDSGLFFTLAGEEERGRAEYEQNLPIFRKNLNVEAHSITLPGEAEAEAKVAQLHQRYAARATEFLATKDMEARRAMYFNDLLPTFTATKEAAQAILDMNQANMVDAAAAARRRAATSSRYLIAAIIIGLAAALVFAWRLQRAILRPIRGLTVSARDLGEGNLDQVVPVQSRDEIGELADSFNKMAGKLRTYRQVTSDEIVRARRTTEAIFSSLPDPVFVQGPSGKIDFVNPAATRLLASAGWSNLPDSLEREANKVLQGAADVLPESFERAICLRLDEREAFLLPRIIGMRDEIGVHGVAIMLQDVTRFRLLDEVKTNLVSTVSHELKTPLTSVRMGLYLLLEEKIGSLNAKQVELLIAARDDSERLLRMINDLLDLAKLEAGASGLNLQTVPAAELFRSAVREATELGEQRHLHIISQIGGELPKVKAEPRQIAHVFLNLITNAVKHSPVGEELILRAIPQEDAVRFSVIDRGPGIPREYHARVFDRFFRAPGAERTGAGLGLAIAREIVAAHRGSIGVASETGKGSEFYFVLPIAAEEDRSDGSR